MKAARAFLRLAAGRCYAPRAMHPRRVQCIRAALRSLASCAVPGVAARRSRAHCLRHRRCGGAGMRPAQTRAPAPASHDVSRASVRGILPRPAENRGTAAGRGGSAAQAGAAAAGDREMAAARRNRAADSREAAADGGEGAACVRGAAAARREVAAESSFVPADSSFGAADSSDLAADNSSRPALARDFPSRSPRPLSRRRAPRAAQGATAA